jgi:hypothetical protein
MQSVVIEMCTARFCARARVRGGSHSCALFFHSAAKAVLLERINII